MIQHSMVLDYGHKDGLYIDYISNVIEYMKTIKLQLDPVKLVHYSGDSWNSISLSQHQIRLLGLKLSTKRA